MADVFGALSLPVPQPAVDDPSWRVRAFGDPCLRVLGSYLATTITALCDEAYQRLEPGIPSRGTEKDLGATGTVIRRVGFYNPTERPIVLADLPAIFVFRGGDRGTYQPFTGERYRKTHSVTAWWVTEQVEGEAQLMRDPFVNAIGDAAASAVRVGYHPSWVLDDDKAKPGAIATSIAGQATAWTVSGGSLNGALASSTLAIPRQVLLHSRAGVGAYVPGSIVVNGIGAKGRIWRDTIAIQTANGGEDHLSLWRFANVTSVEFPEQTTSAHFTLGYAASPEARQGSRMKRAAGLQECFPRRPGEIRAISMPSAPGKPPITLRVYEMQFEVIEDLELDPTARGGAANGGADGTYQIPPVSQGEMLNLPFAQTFATSTF